MKSTKSIDNSALLVMDVQTGIVNNIKDHAQLIKNIKTAITAARKAQVQIIFVKVAFRQGFPEVSPNNKSFSMLRQNSALFKNPDSMEIYPEVAPKQQGIVVTKLRVSAFAGSDLDVILRSQQINHLILSGIATSGVVLSTLRQAADLDYKITVLSDCCADSDEEVQKVLMTKVFPRQAEVMTVNEWKKETKNS